MPILPQPSDFMLVWTGTEYVGLHTQWRGFIWKTAVTAEVVVVMASLRQTFGQQFSTFHHFVKYTHVKYTSIAPMC